jgi:hypothetical protein
MGPKAAEVFFRTPQGQVGLAFVFWREDISRKQRGSRLEGFHTTSTKVHTTAGTPMLVLEVRAVLPSTQSRAWPRPLELLRRVSLRLIGGNPRAIEDYYESKPPTT